MTPSRIAVRTIALVFALASFSMGVVYAHALPGSQLVFSHSNNQLQLSISVPVDDLIVAAPELSELNSAIEDPTIEGSSLSTSLALKISTYFAKHLQLQSEPSMSGNDNSEWEAMSLTMENITLQTAHNEDVGHYQLLVMNLSADLPRPKLGPMQLRYDAVMHEVRTHRASAYWSSADNTLTRLAKFGYRLIDGQQQLISLTQP